MADLEQQHELPVAAEVTHLLGMDSALDNHLPSRVTNRISSQLLGECSAYQVMEWMEWDLAATRNTLFLDACNKVGIVTGPIDLDRVLPKLNIPVLEWAVKYSHMEIKYTETALEDVTLDGRVLVLEWWKKSGLPIKLSAEVLERDYCDDAGVIEWWIKSGLLPGQRGDL
ncbi:hypothetical protein BCR44DRAFT_1438453 [Catenaria anguillulae PL171]|uniref:Uncharacterized protein n=1 Tax=Catenaria anguillulae PL171 TaxID=765915 RepID=A0A1Y2HFP4_9FUNG|nr:hypothetical protein BCR44DRAFT_1438453 [Catenaria anguillulae PL171]